MAAFSSSTPSSIILRTSAVVLGTMLPPVAAARTDSTNVCTDGATPTTGGGQVLSPLDSQHGKLACRAQV